MSSPVIVTPVITEHRGGERQKRWRITLQQNNGKKKEARRKSTTSCYITYLDENIIVAKGVGYDWALLVAKQQVPCSACDDVQKARKPSHGVDDDAASRRCRSLELGQDWRQRRVRGQRKRKR